MAYRKPDHIETRLFINGKFKDASDGGTFELVNPATLEVCAKVAEATVEDTNEAVAAAKAALPAWRDLGQAGRAAPMKKLAALILQAVPELAYLEAISMGKAVSSYWDAYVGADYFETFASLGWMAKGETSLNNPGTVGMTLRQPYGVAGAIIAWNISVMFLCWKAAAALAAGNTLVLKSSEKAPLTAIRIAEMLNDAGFPPGVFNILSGHGTPCGSTLAEHMDVRALSFTGSSAGGRAIAIAAARSNFKHLTLELGGKSPLIVFEDADIDKAVKDSKASILPLAGQMCIASSRVYVHKDIAERFVASMKEAFADTKTGDPLDPSSDRGPQADAAQIERVRKYIQLAKDSGAELAFEGTGPEKGHYAPPVIFLEGKDDAQFMRDEIFGSVVNVSTFETEEEVLRRANDTEYGLYASVYTKDLSRAMRCVKSLEAGTVSVNTASPYFVKDLAFGGYKASGSGREGLMESLEAFLETKTVLMNVG